MLDYGPGEADVAAGDPELAIHDYEKSRNLNPDDRNAVGMLRKRRGEE